MKNLYLSSFNQDIAVCHKDYNIFTMPNNVKLYNHLKAEVENICKLNNINKDKQNYFVSAFKNTAKKLDNDQWYSTTTYRYLSIYGKLYLDDVFVESFSSDEKTLNHTFNATDMFLALDHIENKTKVESDKDYIEFYVAPARLIQDFDCGTWLPI